MGKEEEDINGKFEISCLLAKHYTVYSCPVYKVDYSSFRKKNESSIGLLKDSFTNKNMGFSNASV